MVLGVKTAVCNVCDRGEAFFFRPYSGVSLCRKCFVESVEEKTRATIAKYQMFRFDDRIAVAVSGGKDSVGLLHVLAKIELRHPKARLVAVTVDEGIGGYRDEALKIAAENCEKLEVEHYLVSFKELFGYTFDQMVSRLKDEDDVEADAVCVLRCLAKKSVEHGCKENRCGQGCDSPYA